jgi:hypothetical protein
MGKLASSIRVLVQQISKKKKVDHRGNDPFLGYTFLGRMRLSSELSL